MKALIYEPSPLRWVACKLLGVISPQVYWSRASGLRYGDVPTPTLPNAGWVRLRTRLGGICGTDLALILQRNHPSSYLMGLTSFPIVLGHENLAVIDHVGAEVTGWQPGDRVCVEPALSCGPRSEDPPCRPCSHGQFSLCEKLNNGGLPRGTMIGLNAFTGGSWAPYFVAHHSQLHRVPPDLPDDQAILTDPLACSLHGVLRHLPQNDDTVLINGAGIIGLGVVLAIRALGSTARIMAIARHPFQAALLQELGADEVLRFPRRMPRGRRYELLAAKLGGRRIDGRFGSYGMLGGFDVVFDCAGSGESLTDSLRLTRARGTTILMGTSQITLLDSTPMWNKELTVLGGYGRQLEDYQGRRLHTYELFFELWRDRHLPLQRIPIRRLPAAEYRRALHLLTARPRAAVLKVVFSFDEPSIQEHA